MAINPTFLEWFRSEIDRVADDRAVDARRAFPAWCLEFVYEVDADGAFDQSDTLSQGDAGIDGWRYEEGGRFHLIQAKYPDDEKAVVGVDDLQDLVRGLALLRGPALIAEGPHRPKLNDVALKLEEAVKGDGARVSLDFFVAASITKPAKTQLTAFAEEFDADVQFYELEDFFGIWSARELIGDLHGREVRFPLAKDDHCYRLNCLAVDGVSGALVATLDGRGFGDTIAALTPQIFHRNVRYHLGSRKAVNLRMEQTIKDKEERKAFWLYNNGITLVCDSVAIVGDADRTLVATNPQIVNGAQTAMSLRELRALYETGEISVQARFVSVESSPVGEAAMLAISEFTNSQNAVTVADLKANDPRHKALQDRFRLLMPPWHYERRRGEWNALTAAQKADFATRQVTKEEIGQRWRAFAGDPAEAITAKEKMFSDADVAAAAFDIDRSPYLYLLAYSVYASFSEILNKKRQEELKRYTGNAWTSSNTEAVTAAKQLWVGHMAALTHGLLRERYGDGEEKNLSRETAQQLFELWDSAENELISFVMMRAFQTTRIWLRNLGAQDGVKKALSLPATFADLRDHWEDALVDHYPLEDRMPALPRGDD